MRLNLVRLDKPVKVDKEDSFFKDGDYEILAEYKQKFGQMILSIKSLRQDRKVYVNWANVIYYELDESELLPPPKAK